MSDGAAEGRFGGRASRVYVNPLVVIGGVGK